MSVSALEVSPAYELYVEPHEDEIELEKTKAAALVIHSSTPGAQVGVNNLIESSVNGKFDRLSFPRVADNIVNNSVVAEWAQILVAKHEVQEIHIADTTSKYQRTARAVLRREFPGLNVEFHTLSVDPDVRAEALMIHCADLRYQAAYEKMIEQHGPVSFERIAVAGASIAMHDKRVRPLVKAVVEDNEPSDVFIMDHIDCAMCGGLASHGACEQKEAMYHAESLNQAAGYIGQLNPTNPAEVHQHLLGIEGTLDVEKLQKQMGIRN